MHAISPPASPHAISPPLMRSAHLPVCNQPACWGPLALIACGGGCLIDPNHLYSAGGHPIDHLFSRKRSFR